jgi:4'-phosphopantetheinyl transferase
MRSSILANNYIRCNPDPTGNSVSDKDSAVIDVYFAKTKDISTEYSRLKIFIDHKDKLKAEKLHFREDRNTYLFCHTLLRLILAKKLNADPSGIQIINEGNNKPRLEGDLLFFNISHTRDAFAFAISERVKVGIDLEKVDRNVDFKSIIVKFFSTIERKFILDSPEDSRNRFFLLWTRKESLLKAMGTGIISNLSQVHVMKKENTFSRETIEYMNDDSTYSNHFIYSKKVFKYYLSVSAPRKAKILLHQLNVEKVQYYCEE